MYKCVGCVYVLDRLKKKMGVGGGVEIFTAQSLFTSMQLHIDCAMTASSSLELLRFLVAIAPWHDK